MARKFATLKIADEGWLRWILFSRPNVMNAFDGTQWAELNEALDDADRDEEIRCIALRGTGGHFSAGYDLPAALDELEGAGLKGVRAHMRPGNQACWKVWNSRKPVIAAIEGYCLGGAFELAMTCDFALAEAGAWLGEPEARVAASPPFLISPWIMGIRHAKEVLLTGDLVPAERAERIGLLNEVCERGEIESRVRERARKLAAFPAEAWQMNKAAVNRSYEIMGLNAAIAMGEDAFAAMCLVPDPFKTELALRVRRDGFSAAIKWVQARYE